MTIAVRDIALNVLNMRTRMPFKYGIATLTALPHLFVRVELEVDGKRRHGVASDGLAPKWFTKDPATTVEQDIADMLAVIRSACEHAKRAGPAATAFELWQRVYRAQSEQWTGQERFPPLLWAFGVSLVERAILDAFCRATQTPFAQALRRNTLGIALGDIHAELRGATPADLLPPQPRHHVLARHTVGLADPITDADIPTEEKLDDGLPQSLEQAVTAYGLTHFKIKFGSAAGQDIDRLQRIAAVVSHNGRPFAFTLDGNEAYREVEPFESLWRTLQSHAGLADFMKRLIFVEQPFHRDVALSDGVAKKLLAWKDRPPIIIDESDGELHSADVALRSGYAGTSHKNCKGVFKGVANACLMTHYRRGIISGEDLANVGPIALGQDLLVAANLGIEHVERNGHHYFRGLSMYPPEVQQRVLEHHDDLYRSVNHNGDSIPVVNVKNGRVSTRSLIEGPSAPAFELDTTQFTPLEDWRFESLSLRERVASLGDGG